MSRRRFWPLTAVVIVVVLAVPAGAALLFWPQVHLGDAEAALARLELPGFAGRITAVQVSSATRGPVPVALRQGELWPLRKVAAGERLTVAVTVRRPSWAGWLVGHTQRRSFAIATPSVHVARSLAAGKGRFAGDRGLRCAGRDGLPRRSSPARTLTTPQTIVPVGVVAAARAAPGRSRSPPLPVPGSACQRRLG